MKKLYIRIQYNKTNHTLIRVDDNQAFKSFINSPELTLHYQKILLELKLGHKPDIKPFQIQVEEQEFNNLVKEIKKKISSSYSKDMHFSSISLVEDSHHYPMIKITRKIKEDELPAL